MIISKIELREPHHALGQLRHAYRTQDGFDIAVEGVMVYVRNRLTGRGVLFPASDMRIACTEPDPVPAGADEEITAPGKLQPPPKKAARNP